MPKQRQMGKLNISKRFLNFLPKFQHCGPTEGGLSSINRDAGERGDREEEHERVDPHLCVRNLSEVMSSDREDTMMVHSFIHFSSTLPFLIRRIGIKIQQINQFCESGGGTHA
jgi:hypothetical protein